MAKKIIIDGNNFDTLTGFYDEVERKLTKGQDGKMGRNLDAFNDVLRGGFGVHALQGPIAIHWVNAEKSKKDLGKAETVKHIQQKLKKVHATNATAMKKELENVKDGSGEMLFTSIVNIILEHDNVELRID